MLTTDQARGWPRRVRGPVLAARARLPGGKEDSNGVSTCEGALLGKVPVTQDEQSLSPLKTGTSEKVPRALLLGRRLDATLKPGRLGSPP